MHKTVSGYILDRQLPVVRIELRQLVALTILIEYDQKRKQSAWDRLDGWWKEGVVK